LENPPDPAHEHLVSLAPAPEGKEPIIFLLPSTNGTECTFLLGTKANNLLKCPQKQANKNQYDQTHVQITKRSSEIIQYLTKVHAHSV